MSRSHYSDWIVRFPAPMYAEVCSQILNDCITDTIHESLAGHVFQDVSFLVQDGCDKDIVLHNLVEKLNQISDSSGIPIQHVYQDRRTTFGIDYSGNGKLEFKYS